MSDTAIKKATYDDLLAVPPNLVAEIIRGRLVTHPRPRPTHAVTGARLGMELGGPFDRGRGGPGGWWILYEPELHFGDEVVVPDWAGWRRERLLHVPDTAYFELAPDWVCEILSPSTEKYDRGDKRDIYAEAEVKHLWFINPETRTLEAFELVENSWVLLATRTEADEIAIPPFAEVPFSLGSLWAD